MAANTVEATLRSKFEDGIEKGISRTQAVLAQGLGGIKSASASTAAVFNGLWEGAIGGLERYKVQLQQTATDSDSGFKQIGLGAAVMAVAVTAAFLKAGHAVGEFVFDLVKESSAALEAKIAFESLSKSMGEQADLVLGKLKAATDGQISGTKLMQNANRVMQSGVQISMDQYAKLAENIFRLAKASGVDAAQGIDILTNAVIRGNARGFQAIGLHLAVKDAVTAMAEATGGSSARLADAGKMQAFYNELLKKSEEAASALGPKLVTLEDIIRQSENTWKSLVGAVGLAISRSGTLEELLKILSERMLQMKAGREQMDALTLSTNRWVISGLMGFAGLANGFSATLEVANIFWGTLKILFAVGSSAVILAVGSVTTLIEQMYSIMARLPGAQAAGIRAGYDQVKAINDKLRAAIVENGKAIRDAYDGALPDAAKKADAFALQLAQLAGELGETTEQIVRGTGAHRASAEATETDAEAMKKLNEQLLKYSELRKELLARAGLAGQAALAEVFATWAKIDQELTMKGAEWDKRRAELKSLAVAGYGKTVQDALGKQQAAMQKMSDEADAIGEAADKKRLENMVALGKVEIDYGQKVAENERHFQEVVTAAAKKREEDRRKEVGDAVGAANAIAQSVDLAARGKLSGNTGLESLKQMPATIAVLQKQLDVLRSKPILTEEQVEDVIRLQTAIERLNRINLTPFQKAVAAMRDQLKQFVEQGTNAWANFWSALVQGQDNAGKQLVSAFIGMIGQMLVHIGVILIQSGIAEIALAQTLVGRLMGASVAGGLKAIAAGAIVAAVGGIMQGAAANMAQSSASSGSGAATPVQSAAPSNQVQTINVGAPGRAQSSNEVQKPKVVELRVSMEPGLVVTHLKRAYKGNNTTLREVLDNG